MAHIPRFYCPDITLQADSMVLLSETAAHHARVVMRLRAGEDVRLFNADQGEWHGLCHFPDKRSVSVTLTDCIKATERLPDVWLIMAPLKNKEAFDNAIRHAVELGVRKIVLVTTDRTQQHKINADRLRQQIIDAAQQCGRLGVPECLPPQPLSAVLKSWPSDRVLLAGVEGQEASPSIAQTLATYAAKPSLALLIGPEGGFSDKEKDLLLAAQKDWLKPVSLGSLILRSDTAAAAGLAISITV